MGKKKYNCPVEAALSQLGGKYKAIILYYLLTENVLRFSRSSAISPGPRQGNAPNSSGSWEGDGLIHRTVYPVVPQDGIYPDIPGESLRPVIFAICDWGREYMAGTF